MRRPLLIVAALVLADQIIKLLARAYGEPGGWFTLAYNPGVTFGFLRGANAIMVLVSAVAIALLVLAIRRSEAPDRYVLAAILAGVFGNVIDRVVAVAGRIMDPVRYGHLGVVDWLRIGTFPVFNLADALIVCGVLAMVLLEIPWVRRSLRSRRTRRARRGDLAP